MSAPSTFDFGALMSVVNHERHRRGLTWYQLADELWDMSAELNAQRNDHPL